MTKQLSDKDKKVLKEILSAIENRIISGSTKGGLTSKDVDYTVYYLFKYER